MDWHHYSHGLTLRAQQIEALNLLAATTAPVVFLQAPPGAGKSAILTTYFQYRRAQLNCTGYLVTPQRALQQQLATARIPGIRMMQGVRNYRCPEYAKDPDGHREDHRCKYYDALNAASSSPLVIHNYASFLHQRRHFGQRGFLGLDEGHRAPGALVDFLTLELDDEQIEVLQELGDVSLETLRTACAVAAHGYDQAEALTDNPDDLVEQVYAVKSVFDSVFRQMRQFWWLYGFESFACTVGGYKAPDDTSESEFSPVDLEFAFDPASKRLVPTRIAATGRLLLSRGDKVIVTSATILSARMLAGELGVTDQYEYIELPSTFPIESRPIVMRLCGKMTQREQASTLPRLIALLASDAVRHVQRRENGIIHTVSHELARLVMRELGQYDELQDRLVLLPVGAARDATIADFLAAQSAGKILVGPGLHEGVDGAYDSARWQAIVKAPLPYMGDVRYQAIKRRSAPAAANWYAWQAAQTFAQMCGRVTRAADDYGVTYVYDSAVRDIVDGAFCPEYVREAIVNNVK